jgi:putative membrane protein
MRLIVWLFRAFLLFTLFAFALNNLQAVTVRWFFGVEWHTPLVIVVLVAFSGGCVIGVLAMIPSWWRLRRQAQRNATPAAAAAVPAPSVLPSEFGPADHPRRAGL